MNRALIAAFCVLANAYAETGSLGCAPCHRTIWQSYTATAMAKSSGPAVSAPFSRQRFTSPGGTVRYSVSATNGGLSYTAQTAGVDVDRRLDYFIGSGAVGRSYLTWVDRFLFQAPVSFYSSDSTWRISPGFNRTEALNVARPVEASCLNCHASGVQPLPGTVNGYEPQAFLDGGVSCERCHGAGEQHIAARSRATIINPARLAPAERDSICQQCHLSGEVRVAKLGVVKPFVAGGLLADSSATFVWSPPKERQVNGHVEELARSRCKVQSGDKLWCGTCHSPHSVPAPARKAEFYRERCNSCHTAESCTAPKSARNGQADDCTACHMPRSPVRDVQHAAYTDHTIPKRGHIETPPKGKPALVAFAPGATDRDLALANALVALREGDRELGLRAFEALRIAVTGNRDDIPAASQLAQLYDRMGQEANACAIYQQIVKAPQPPPAASINWGTCLAKEGRLTDAIPIWQSVVTTSPAEEGAWINLAVAQLQTGNSEQGRNTLRQALRFHPASVKARQLLKELTP